MISFIDSKLSPFYPYIFQDENKLSFKNIYQYYLYKKFNIPVVMTDFITLLKMSNNKRDKIIPDWDKKKYNIMLDGYNLAIKFNPDIKNIVMCGEYVDNVPDSLSFWKIKFNSLIQELRYNINMNNMIIENKKFIKTVVPTVVPKTVPTAVPKTVPTAVPKTVPTAVPINELKTVDKTVFNDNDNIMYNIQITNEQIRKL